MKWISRHSHWFSPLALIGILAVAAAALVAGCGGSGSSSTSNPSSQAAVEHVHMVVLNGEMATERHLIAQDGLGHDTFMVSNLSGAKAQDLSRSDLNVQVGDTVEVTVTNYDEGPHTFTAPDLDVNAQIAPAKDADKGIPSKTTFRFTVTKAGKFRWYCETPCDAGQGGWAMTADKNGPARDGYMAGYVIAS